MTTWQDHPEESGGKPLVCWYCQDAAMKGTPGWTLYEGYTQCPKCSDLARKNDPDGKYRMELA